MSAKPGNQVYKEEPMAAVAPMVSGVCRSRYESIGYLVMSDLGAGDFRDVFRYSTLQSFFFRQIFNSHVLIDYPF